MPLRHIVFRLATSPDHPVREETLDGKRYVVAPVVASKVGVLERQLITAAAWRRLAPTGEGTALTVNHPREQRPGESFEDYQVARAADVQQRAVGLFRNVKLIHANQGDDVKPAGEVWIEADNPLAAQSIERARKGEKIEVSVGIIGGSRPESGTFGGEEYEGVVENGYLDHLALIVNGTGWCSVGRDGCGVNQPIAASRPAALAAINAPLPGDLRQRTMIVADAVREKFRRDNPRDPESMKGFVFVDGIQDATAFFERDEQHFSVSYTYVDASQADDGKPVVELGEETPVRFNLNIQSLAARAQATPGALFRAMIANFTGGPPMKKAEMIQALKAAKKIGDTTAAELERMDDGSVKELYALHAERPPEPTAEEREKAEKDALVTQLMAKGDFTKEALDAMSICTLKSIAAVATAPAATPAGAPAAAAPQSLDADGVKTIVAGVVTEALKKFEPVLTSHQAGVQAEEVAKEKIVKALVASDRCQFTETELKGHTLPELRKLNTMLAPVSYLGAAGGVPELPEDAETEKAAQDDAKAMYTPEPRPN